MKSIKLLLSMTFLSLILVACQQLEKVRDPIIGDHTSLILYKSQGKLMARFKVEVDLTRLDQNQNYIVKVKINNKVAQNVFGVKKFTKPDKGSINVASMSADTLFVYTDPVEVMYTVEEIDEIIKKENAITVQLIAGGKVFTSTNKIKLEKENV